MYIATTLQHCVLTLTNLAALAIATQLGTDTALSCKYKALTWYKQAVNTTFGCVQRCISTCAEL